MPRRRNAHVERLFDCSMCTKTQLARKRDVMTHILFSHLSPKSARYLCVVGCHAKSHPGKGPFRCDEWQKMQNHLKCTEHQEKMATKRVRVEMVNILHFYFENKYSRKYFDKFIILLIILAIILMFLF